MANSTIYKKTRIAPTPSGYLHLGNILSFALTAGLARQTVAKILLRIDDLDRDRVEPDYILDIFETLDYMGIPWDEGPRNIQEFEGGYSQMYRLPHYLAALDQLRRGGKLFACTCSRADVLRDSKDGGYAGTCREKGISFDTEDCSWRVRTEGEADLATKAGLGLGQEGDGEVEVKTIGGGMVREVLPVGMRDFVVRKKDGFPAYQLTSVIDDLHYEIDLVVRGADLLPSTIAQHWLARQLGRQAFGEISFYHHPLLCGPGGEKLSKSAGATSVQYLRREGRKPAEIYGMIAVLAGMDSRPENWQELAAGMGIG